MLPIISIITPSFNQGAFIERTIRSVLDQEYLNLQYIIIDGGSTDETVSIIERCSARPAYWVGEPDRGQTRAINKGLSAATGGISAGLGDRPFRHYVGAVRHLMHSEGMIALAKKGLLDTRQSPATQERATSAMKAASPGRNGR